MPVVPTAVGGQRSALGEVGGHRVSAPALRLEGWSCNPAVQPAPAASAGPWGPIVATLMRGRSVAWAGSEPAVLDQLVSALLGAPQVGPGRIEVCGRSLAEWSPRELACRLAAIGLEPLEPPELPGQRGVPVGEAVAFGRLVRRPDPARDWIVQDALREIGLLHRAHERMGGLTPIDRLRVRLARLMAQLWDHAHGLILLHRAFDVGLLGGLDAVQALLRQVLAFAQPRGHALVLVQPDLPQLMALVERVWLIERNGVQADLVSRTLPAAWLNEDITRVGARLLRFA